MTYDIREGLNPKRLTIAMWDYSYLNAHYPGASFEDYDKVTDELLERGFNTVRIEAFPWIIGQLNDRSEEVTIGAEPLSTWGYSDIDRKHRVADELIEFMRMSMKKNFCVILSTWAKTCKEYPHKDAKMFREVWSKTLDLLEGEGLLESVVYVDLDQEFPYFSVFRNELDMLGGGVEESTEGQGADNMAAAGMRKPHRGSQFNELQLDYLQKHYINTLKCFQSKYPGQRFTASYTGYWNEHRQLNLKMLDILELHFWIHGPKFNNRTYFDGLPKDRREFDYKDYQGRVHKTFKSVRPMLIHEMHRRLEAAIGWGEEISTPVVNTESWGPWWHMDHSDLEWSWLKDWCIECNRLAGEYGLWGSTPWNYSHPYWSHWNDVKWYLEANSAFASTPRSQQSPLRTSDRILF